MAEATLKADFTESLPPGVAGVTLTQTGTTSTYVCPYFHLIIAIVENNFTDKDGAAISWSGNTITITTIGATDVVNLIIAGRG